MKQSYGKASKIRVIRVLEAILAISADIDHDIDGSDISKPEIYTGKNKNEIFIKTTIKKLIKLIWLHEKGKGTKELRELKSWEIRDVFKHLENTLKILHDLRNKRQGSSEIFIMLKMWYGPKHIHSNIDKVNQYWTKPLELNQNTEDLFNTEKLQNDFNADLAKFNSHEFSSNNSDVFIGREWLINDVLSVLNDDAARAVLVISEPGLGKTAFIKELINGKKKLNILAYYFCHKDIKHTLKTSTFVSSIITQISSKIEEYSIYISKNKSNEEYSHKNLEDDPIYTLHEELIRPLSKINNPGKQYYILIDALDETLSTINTQQCKSISVTLQEYLVSFPKWIKFIITTRKIAEIISCFDRFPQLEIHALEKRNLSDISKYIDYHIAQAAISSDLDYSEIQLEDVSKKICDYSQGNFLYAHQAIEGIKNKYYSQENIGSLPPGLFGLYLDSFSKLFQDPQTFISTKQILQILSASAEPLQKRQIIQICNLTSEEDLEKRLLPIQEYLNISKGLNSNEYIRIFHHSLIDWLTSKDVIGTPFYISVRQGHECIADWCLRMIEEHQLHCPSYVEQYAPYHLINAGLGNKLIDLLHQHPIYIQRSIKSIIDSCTQDQEWPIHAISDFLFNLVRTNDHFAVSIVLSVAEQLLEKRFNTLAQDVISLIPPNFIYFNIIQSVIKAKLYLVEANFSQANKLLIDIFQDESIPKSIKGMAGINLIESYKFLGDIAKAKKATLSLEKLLNPKFDFELWMRSQCELSELEFIEGDLPNSWCRLNALHNCAVSRNSYRLLSTINYLRGEILYSLDKYLDANDAFLLSFEQSNIENIVEQANLSRICLAKNNIFYHLSKVEGILQGAKNSCSESNGLQSGLIHYVEAIYNLKINKLNDSLYFANIAEGIFSSLSANIWLAQCMLLTAMILHKLGKNEACCSYAYKANSLFQAQNVFPSLRMKAYEQMMISAKLLGREDEYHNCDNLGNINNLEYCLHFLCDETKNQSKLECLVT